MRFYKAAGMRALFWASKWLLRLRYRVKVEGLNALKRRSVEAKGILLLSNHSSRLDGLLLLIYLWPTCQFRPILLEDFRSLPLISWFLKRLDCILVPPGGDHMNQFKVKKIERSIAAVAKGLDQKKSALLFPSGVMKLSAKERLGGAFFCHSVLQSSPEASIALIRISGLWGSSFSWGLKGKHPNLGEGLRKGVMAVLKNGFFFLPRREVRIQIETEPLLFPKAGSRTELNHYLEHWFNQYPALQNKFSETEPLKLVPYAFWRKTIDTTSAPIKEPDRTIAISEQTRSKIYTQIRSLLDQPHLSITPEKNLRYDLEMDSLNIANLISYLIQNFKVENIEIRDLKTIQDVLEIAEGAKQQETKRSLERKFRWPKETNRPHIAVIPGKTLPEAFFLTADFMGSAIACADDIAGVLSYRKLKQLAVILATHFQKFPEQRVGVMLPASAGALTIILALQIAGKIPVMLNWTLGSKCLEEMVRISGIQRVLSSERFLDRLPQADFGRVINQIELLEEVRNQLNWKTKLQGLFLARKKAEKLLEIFNISTIQPNEPGVILFSSGTEAIPKGIPLSHQNILHQVRETAERIEEFGLTSSGLATLPPFHVFGLICNGYLTLLKGMRIAFYPNPTDITGLAAAIHHWESAWLCLTPTLLLKLLKTATPEQLQTIRFFLLGAEKTPQEIYDAIVKLDNKITCYEGYGLSECTGTVTTQRKGREKKGVGMLLESYEFCTIHVETHQPLAQGSEGEICLKGPSIFNGYLGDAASPFIEINGKPWFRTGDIGFMDTDGTVFISGRLKRFAKIGGEMVSLRAVEEALEQKNGQATLAVCADEQEEDTRLILFTTDPIDPQTANQRLRQAGFSSLIKISQVKHIPEMPLLGTGKMNYRQLNEMVRLP